MEETLSIAWWNTGVSPAKKRDRSTQEELELAFALIAEILIKHDLDIFCLGEMSPSDVTSIEWNFAGNGYYIYDGTYSEGRIKHDMCVLIKTSKLTYLDSKSITEQTILGKIRAGQELKIAHNISGDVIYLYISHWPSRSNDTNQGMPKRYELGKALRGAIDRCIEEKSGKYFILIGDYNDDPYDESLTYALGATRDRALAISNNSFFYNPFWNFMGGTINFPLEGHEICTYGTYFYKKGGVTRWHTFDQIIFSSSFLTGDKWSLVEDEVKVVNDSNLRTLVINAKTNFDHLPVVAIVKRG